MIRRLRIRNFKSLRDSGDLKIRPLTFLIGPNSGGKSSVLQCLRLLRQTADSRDITNPLLINGPYVQLGSYRELIFGQDCHNNLHFEFAFEPQEPFYLPDYRVGKAGLITVVPQRGSMITFACEFGYTVKTMQISLVSMVFSVQPAGMEMRVKRTVGGKHKADFHWNHEHADLPVAGIHKFYGASGPLSFRVQASMTREAAAKQLLPSIIAREASDQIEKLFGGIFYIGPLREWPKRVYVATGGAPQDVGLKGELFVDVLWIQSRRKRERERLLGAVNRWVGEFGFATQVTLKRLGGNNYSLTLADPQTRLNVNVADIGFGASQVLPIIVEGFYAPRRSMLLIEQPEIHLHPRAQATLADLLIEIAKSGKALLVETHSEHLLSRVQRRVADGSISNTDVAIYYCRPTPEGTDVREIRLDELGQFETEGLPEGFFEEGYLESIEHFKAMADRSKG